MEEKKKSFNELINGDAPVMVDFSAEWCAPCKMMKPILAELKTRLGDKMTIIKVDVDSNPAISSLYNVRSVPTLAVFKKGNIVWRNSGVMGAEQLAKVVLQLS